MLTHHYVNYNLIVELYKQDITEREICKRVGVSNKTIYAALRRLGVPFRRKLSCNLPAKEICNAYLAGESSVTLGHKFNVVPQTIINILKQHNVARRLPRHKITLDPTKLRYLYVEQKRSISDVAAELKCSPCTVRHNLVKNNISLRSLGEAVQLSMWKHWDKSSSAARRKESYVTHFKCVTCKKWYPHEMDLEHDSSGAPLCPNTHRNRKLRSKPRSKKYRYERVYPHGPTKPAWAQP